MWSTIEPFTRRDAEACVGWRYEPPYDFYDGDRFPDDVAEFLDPANWIETYFAVRDERGDLVGFFEFERKGDEIEVGLGLRPDLTGRGLGGSFVRTALAFAEHRWTPASFRLEVATWNERAIRTYEACGFARGEAYDHDVGNGETVRFLRMHRPA